MKKLEFTFKVNNSEHADTGITDTFVVDVELFSADRKVLLCHEAGWKLNIPKKHFAKSVKWKDKDLEIIKIKRGERKEIKGTMIAPDNALPGKYLARIFVAYVDYEFRIHWDEGKQDWQEFELK